MCVCECVVRCTRVGVAGSVHECTNVCVCACASVKRGVLHVQCILRSVGCRAWSVSIGCGLGMWSVKCDLYPK